MKKLKNKRKSHKHMSRTDADIIAAKIMLNDRARGVELGFVHYDQISDRLCGEPSRRIYNE